MKKKLPLQLIGLMIIIFISGVLVKSLSPEFRRNQFEKFLIDDIKSLNKEYDSDKGSQLLMDKPEMAGIQDYYMTIDPKLKRVPHERRVNAIKETKKRAEVKSDLTNRYIWNEVPSNMGGRVRCIMFDPNDSEHNKVWAGSVTGGLWYNNDIFSNDQWHPVSDIWENLSISCIVYDPNDQQTFYVGTGEPETAVTIYRESSARGVGIWKTTDRGTTWELLPSTTNFPYISDMVIRDEDEQSVIYAGVVSGTYQGEDHTPTPSDGLYRSVNGGNTWQQVFPNIEGEDMPYSPSDLEIAASDRIFAGTYRNIDGFGGATILYSDDGINWTVFDDYNHLIKESTDPTVQIPGRTIIASSPSSPNTIYTVMAAGGFTNENWIYYRGMYILKSDDNGETWVEKTLPYGDDAWATLAWHALIIKVDPNNKDVIYTGGLNLHQSTDGGLTWKELSSWYNYGIYYNPNNPPYVHADQHDIAFKPGSSDTICFTNDGGAFLTFNGNTTAIDFHERNISFNSLQFYTCDIHPDSATHHFIGGLQDNGTILFDGKPIDNEDSYISGGDGAYCFFDKDDYLISTVYYNMIYIFKKSSSGYNFQNRLTMNSGTFISPSDYDDVNKTFYANAIGFTGSRADQILRIKNITTASPSSQYINLGTGSNVHFSHVKLSKYSNPDNRVLYVGTQSGKLFKVENINSTPVSIDIGTTIFPLGNISCIAEGKNENELLVTFSNYGVSSVWYTDDRGDTWTEKEGDLPDMPVRWALFDPGDTSKVILATEVGVWATPNIYEANVNWEPVINGFANVRVDMLQLREWDNTILAATHGRGLYYCDLEGGTSPETTTTTNEFFKNEKMKVNVYPNPASDYIKVEIPDYLIQNITISIFDEKGTQLKNISLTKMNNIFEINVSNMPNGIYFLNITAGNQKTTKKIIIKK